jgi:hypothetical protein
MSRPYSSFTREDEKELFNNGININPNFLKDFRSFYSNRSTESCSVEVQIVLFHANVDEIESWEPSEILARVGGSFDTSTTTLKLPDNIRKLVLACDMDESFLDVLSAQITNFQLQKILQKNPNKYKCVTCQKTHVTRGVAMVRRGANDTTWSIYVFPCFPAVCDSDKCKLIATKCAEKMLSTLTSVTIFIVRRYKKLCQLPSDQFWRGIRTTGLLAL